MGVIHRNPEYWTDPDRFYPERFDDAQTAPAGSYAYCPFGFGPRICPGEKLNKVETRMRIALIMQAFDFELDMPLDEVIREEKLAIMAKNDIRMKLTKRTI